MNGLCVGVSVYGVYVYGVCVYGVCVYVVCVCMLCVCVCMLRVCVRCVFYVVHSMVHGVFAWCMIACVSPIIFSQEEEEL